MNLRIVILSTLLSIGSVLPKKFDCSSTDNQCDCMYTSGGKVDLYCPTDNNMRVSLTVYSDQMSIRCDSSPPDEKDFNYIPKIDVNHIVLIDLTKCIVPSGRRSFIQALDKLNLNTTNLKTFFFKSGYGSRHAEHYGVTKHSFKGLELLKRLYFTAKDVSALPSDLFESLGKLEWLTWKTDMVGMADGIFDALVNLETLEINHNKLHSLPSEFLRNQRKLRTLNAAGNKLNNLTRDMFIGAINVDNIDLSANDMSVLSSDVFAEMTNLTMINLSANNFTSLPEGLFSNNKLMKMFKMINNRTPLKTLPSDFLANLTNLEDVNLRADLEVIPETVFDGSSNIKNISLADNLLEVLPIFLFKDQVSLEMLDLSNNRITELDKDLFSYTSKLTWLHLSNNKIKILGK